MKVSLLLIPKLSKQKQTASEWSYFYNSFCFISYCTSATIEKKRCRWAFCNRVCRSVRHWVCASREPHWHYISKPI